MYIYIRKFVIRIIMKSLKMVYMLEEICYMLEDYYFYNKYKKLHTMFLVIVFLRFKFFFNFNTINDFLILFYLLIIKLTCGTINIVT